jgi:hypothetical protein
MLVTLMTGLAIWTLVSVVFALIAGRVMTFHGRVDQLPPFADTVRDYLSIGSPRVPIRQT